jgi:Flp pilus assembly protein TadB
MLPDTGMLLSALIAGGIGAGLLLVIAGLRGVIVDPARPPGPFTRAAAALTSPAFSGRIGAGVLLCVGTLILTRWPVAAAGLGALVIAWPGLFGGTRAEQAQINRLEALVIWTESLRDTIAAHASLERAIPASTQHAPPLTRPALVRLAGQISVRTPLDRALLALAVDLDDPSADFVIAALILNIRRRGDQLARVLTGLTTAAREELDLRRKVSAGRAGLRRGVQIVVLLTIGFAAYLTVFSRDYVQPYDSAGGQVALGVVIGMFALGFAWMRRLSAGRVVRPFLARPGLNITPADVQVVSALTGLSGSEARRLSTAAGTGAQ